MDRLDHGILFLTCFWTAGGPRSQISFSYFSRFFSFNLLFCVTLHQDTLSLPYLVTLLKFGFHAGAMQYCIIREKRNDDTAMGATHAGRAACISTGQDKMI